MEISAVTFSPIQSIHVDQAKTESFSGIIQEKYENFQAVLEKADKTAEAAMLGEASPHELMEALAQAQLAVETAVTFREKIVEAYQEIMRMPV